MKTCLNYAKSVVSTVGVVGAILLTPVLLDKSASDFSVSAHFGATVFAQDKGKKVTRRLPGIGEKIFKGLGKVTELAAPNQEKNPGKKPNFKAAYKELKAMEKKCVDSCNGYEKSQIYNMFAFVAYQLENYDEAVDFYKKVVAQSPEIPVGVELQSLMYIAQLSFQLEKYEQSIQYLERWKKLAAETGNPIGPNIYQLTAVICYQDDRKKCAFDNIKKAVDMVEAKGNVAEESWYNLLRSMYIERENYKVATTILEKMIRHYPKKSYWAQLGSMYGLLEKETDQLHAMDTAYLMGALNKEKQLVNLSYLYLAEEVPYRSASILEKGMKDKIIPKNEKNLETLAIAWQNAREPTKAIPVLEEASKNSSSGNYYGQLVGVYLDLQKPQKAIEAGKQALKKGNFKRGMDGEVHINMGIAYFEQKQYTKAIESFEKAAKIKKHAKFARSWLRYAQNEKKRYLGLKEALASVGLDIDKVTKSRQ